jgi:hypothetical protein
VSSQKRPPVVIDDDEVSACTCFAPITILGYEIPIAQSAPIAPGAALEFLGRVDIQRERNY